VKDEWRDGRAIPRDCSAGRVNAAAEAASKEVVKRGKEENNMMKSQSESVLHFLFVFVKCTYQCNGRTVTKESWTLDQLDVYERV